MTKIRITLHKLEIKDLSGKARHRQPVYSISRRNLSKSDLSKKHSTAFAQVSVPLQFEQQDG